jgi:MSHA pilin protein MshC
MKNRKNKGDSADKMAAAGAAGFTFLEILAALLIIGILSAVAIEHTQDFEADVAGAAEVVKGHLHYAQIKAINSDVKWGLNFSGNSYVLQDENGVTANLPGDLPQGITYSASTNPVMFDLDGSPGASQITITMTKGAASRTLVVVKNTGAVYVQ